MLGGGPDFLFEELGAGGDDFPGFDAAHAGVIALDAFAQTATGAIGF